MTDRGHGQEVEGGVPVGRRVPLPRGAQRPIRVYVNGTEQVEDEDYRLHDGEVTFRDPIMKEDLRNLPFVRKTLLGLGLVGSYQRNEMVDVEYQLNGRTELASDLRVLPD